MLVQLTGFRVQGSRFKVQGSRFKVQGSRFKVLLDAGSMRHARRKAYSRNSNSPLATRNSKLETRSPRLPISGSLRSLPQACHIIRLGAHIQSRENRVRNLFSVDQILEDEH